jgi:rod shape-determining protein MreC
MFLDRYTDSSTQLRSYLTAAASPLFYVASLPQTLFSGASEQFMSQQAVLDENARLKKTLLQQSGQMQLLRFLQQENEKLRALLGSSALIEDELLVAEVLAVYSHPFSHQVVLNKGSKDGVSEHQPLIDDQGVVGQVVSVGPSSSRALLISDNTHALAVRAERTGVRAIVEGLGQWDLLRVMHLPHSTDMREGDRLVTSGLDGRFPEGYPVARVVRISQDASQPFMVVYVEPYAQLDRIRHVLLLSGRKATAVEPAPEQP